MGTYQCVHGSERELLVGPDVPSQEEVAIERQKSSPIGSLHLSALQSAKSPGMFFVRPIDGFRRFTTKQSQDERILQLGTARRLWNVPEPSIKEVTLLACWRGFDDTNPERCTPCSVQFIWKKMSFGSCGNGTWAVPDMPSCSVKSACGRGA